MQGKIPKGANQWTDIVNEDNVVKWGPNVIEGRPFLVQVSVKKTSKAENEEKAIGFDTRLN